ncbi:protein of unknown function [Amycolatopsis xylanica]|uniref:DUF4333 domain-containing protein n=1 Tax=Amycolatopsis xylanica TaxID=589385 RepID=A0A1H3K4U5_9PSEU|nr:DUF4333 domain-containing protein [Amycolatopsis xylanica]SDY46628.1 protein of unknown function [Amycolatopsis xylanica]
MLRTVLTGLSGVVLLTACSGGDPAPVVTTTTVTAPASSLASVPVETTPRTKVFDHVAMERSVKQILTESYKVSDVAEVTCPADLEVKDGRIFDCEASVGGAPKRVPITVKGTDGNYEVGAPVK